MSTSDPTIEIAVDQLEACHHAMFIYQRNDDLAAVETRREEVRNILRWYHVMRTLAGDDLA